MFFTLVLFFLGGSYIYWKYHQAVDKKAFFKSAFFLSIVGSLSILIASLLVVNNFFPHGRTNESTYQIEYSQADTLKIDTSFVALRNELNPEAHFARIMRLSGDSIGVLTALEKNYSLMMRESDTLLKSIGHFGEGVILLKRYQFTEAIDTLSKAPNQQLPYLNWCLAKAYDQSGKAALAEEHYWKELMVEKGNFGFAYLALWKQYKEESNYDKLKELLDRFPEHSYLMDQNLVRLVQMYEGDFGSYLMTNVDMIISVTKAFGFVAALFVSIIWIVYLFQLNVFKPIKALNFFLMFLGGSVFVQIALIFNDFNHLYIQSNLDDTFFHDLLYCIFMIGVPEEFAKIFPFLLLVTFLKPFREPFEYIAYACACALGFAFVENLLYFQNSMHGIIHGRAYISVIGHMVDSSIVAYAFVLYHFKFKKDKSLLVLFFLTFLAGSTAHGLFDFFLLHDHILLFFIFFVFIVQIWIIIINNCLNNSHGFAYPKIRKSDNLHIYITVALTLVFAGEYLLIGFSDGSDAANRQFYSNFSFAGFSIIFFTSNLSSFNLVRGYWRDVYFSSREKRGYGTLSPRTALISWYFVNSIRAHNYVGKSVILYNDPYNRTLEEVLDQQYSGNLIDRIILHENGDPDPHWFLLQLSNPIPFEEKLVRYVLVKLRNQEESLVEEEYVQVFFKPVLDVNLLNEGKFEKDNFPSYGWTRLALDRQNNIS